MMPPLGWALLAMMVATLSGCGFHLRGLEGTMKPLPFTLFYLDARKAALGGDVLTLLNRDSRVKVVSSPQCAEMVMSILSENHSKDTLTLTVGGKINEYQLTYTAVVRILLFSEPLEREMAVVVRRHMTYSDRDILAKAKEEALLFADARLEAAEQIVRRLAYLERQSRTKKLTGQQSLELGDANRTF